MKLLGGPVSKTILFYAVPSVVSLVVNGLYNIVDQIFIGWGIGYICNSATNVIFPLTVFAAALGVLFGDGAATYLSLKLGRNEKENAKKGVTNGILLSVICGILLLILSAVFLEPIEILFGATEAVLPYGMAYGRIIVLGFPFVLISTTLCSIIRADGSPKAAMASLLAGAVWNTIMDPIAIFVLGWGIEGAAIATVSGQILSFLVTIAYLGRFKLLTITKADYKLKFKYIRSITPLGISGFINQMAIVVMTAALNNILVVYGENSVYGSEIPLAVTGIVLKVNQILLFIIVGIASSAQPLISYNYGLGNYQRVRQGFRFCITWATIEKPVKALILSLSRQIVFLIPLAMWLPTFLGIDGILWAGPAADALSFILAVIIIVYEMKLLKAKEVKP